MTPMRVVTLRRWEIAVAFAAVTLAFVVQGVLLAEQGAETRRLVIRQHELSVARVRDRKRTDARICAKIDRLDTALLKVVGSPRPSLKPGQYGYDYWVHHPNEKIGRPGSDTPRQLIAAADVLAELRKAACDPRNLTKGQGP